ncbi:MAG TPA: PrgI family protein [Candidatus Saccharimonadales bacterium]|nr:PrgI family protein [Candidatus Saccharimonadales bacterium]
MAVYKVIQDIESEDKLLGPLTLKGFVYAAICFICLFIDYKLLLVVSQLKWLFIFLFLIPAVLFGVLASPLGREQPTEVWLLSRIRYFIKPRQRIWDQEGQNNLVTVTAPKKQTNNLSKDLTPGEVESRLKTLALTLDTRGWAVKNVNVNLNEPDMPDTTADLTSSDRLISGNALQQTPTIDIHPADDILDEHNNPIAQKFAGLIQRADDQRRRGVLAALKGLGGHEGKIIKPSKHKKRGVSKTKRSSNEDAPPEKLNSKENLSEKLAEARLKFISEHGPKKPHQSKASSSPAPQTQTADSAPVTTSANPVTVKRQAVNMELAQSGSAFSVATLSQLANRQPKIEQTGPDEVTISLH